MTKLASVIAATGVALLASTSAFAMADRSNESLTTPAASVVGASDEPTRVLTFGHYVTFPANNQPSDAGIRQSSEGTRVLAHGQWEIFPGSAS